MCFAGHSYYSALHHGMEATAEPHRSGEYSASKRDVILQQEFGKSQVKMLIAESLRLLTGSCEALVAGYWSRPCSQKCLSVWIESFVCMVNRG